MSERPDVLSTQDGQHSGTSQEVEPGRTHSIIRAQGADVRPSLITISWSIDTPFLGGPEVAPALGKRDLLGLLDFGNNGASHVVAFDWGRGGQITITATSFHLKAQNSRDARTTFRVQAAASYESRPGIDAARVTLTNRFTVGPAQSATIYAPTFAHLVTVYCRSALVLDNRELLLEFLGLDGIVEYEHIPRNSTITDAVELPNEVAFVRVNKTTPGVVAGSLLWYLSL